MDGVADGHLIGVVDELIEKMRFDINAIERFLVTIVQEADVGAEEVTCEQGEDLGLMQNVEEGIKVVNAWGGLLEEGIEHACGLGLDHLDDLQWVLVLAIVGVDCGGRRDNELDGFTNKGRVVSDIIEKFGVVGLELLHEIGYNKQLEEFGFGFEELLKLFGGGFAVPSGRHGFFKYYYLPT